MYKIVYFYRMNATNPPKIDLSQQFRIFAGDAWTIAVADYAFGDTPSHKSIRSMLNEKRHTVKDSGTTYRLINHWTEVGLIEDADRKSKEGWRRLSLIDLVWIQVLIELRGFGVPLDLLRIARSAIFDVPNKPDIVKPEFEYAIANCFSEDPERFLLVFFSDGWAEVAAQSNFELSVQGPLLSAKSYLIVNLNFCCKSVIPKLPLPKFNIQPQLSEEEISVIASVRSGKYDVVEIHGADGNIDRIKCRTTTNKTAERLDDLARRIEFGEFTVKIQKGKAVLTEITESKKA